MLLGFGLAGVVQTLFSRYNLARFFAGSSIIQSVKGVLVGAPLPVCSCGVVPVSLALSRSGVPRPALMSFLISTPETGIASVLISLALLGPLFTWLRPLTAAVTAFVAGVLIAFWDRGREPDWPQSGKVGSQPATPIGDSYSSWLGFIILSLKNGFVDILDDVAFWLVVGIVLSAVVTTMVPPHSLLGLSPWLALLLALVAGLPLYMCAVASTPVAMALLAKGLAPGAVLVFLLVGPATNVGTLSLLYKFYGRRFVLMYVGVVSVCALAVGALINLLAVDVTLAGDLNTEVAGFSWVSYVFGIALAMLLLVSLLRTGLRTGLSELLEHLDSLTLGYATPSAMALLDSIKQAGRWFVLSPFKRLSMLVAAGMVLVLMMSSFVLVGPGHEGFILRFGRISAGPLKAGAYAKWPWPVETVVVVPTNRLQEIRVGFHIASQDAPAMATAVGALDMQHKNATVLTSDELLVEVPFSVRYRVRDSRRYYFDLADARGVLQSLAEDAVRQSARAESFDGIVSIGREEFARDCESRLEALLDTEDLGVDLLGVLLVDSHPHADTADAFRSVSDALEDRATRIEVSRAKRIKMLAGAKGEGARMRSKALQDAARTMAEARGRALAFSGLRAAYEVSPELTRMRLRLEAAKRALVNSTKWILPSSKRVLDLWFGMPAWASGTGGK